MPLAYAQSLGDGVTRVFSVPFPYISKTHVQVRVEGAIVPFSWLSETSIQLATAPAVNAVVDRRRVTPRDTLLVDFVDGSTLVESDLDLSALQVFYLSQEAFDLGEASLGVTEDGSFSALNRRISNVLNPVNPQDVATKNFVETGVTSQVAIATQKANEAANSAGQSEASATNSAQQAASALASKNAAAGSATAAAQSETNALANKNQTQLDRAATAADRVQTGLDRAASSASAAAAKKSAEDAALFDPSSYYTKTQINATLGGYTTTDALSSGLSAKVSKAGDTMAGNLSVLANTEELLTLKNTGTDNNTDARLVFRSKNRSDTSYTEIGQRSTGQAYIWVAGNQWQFQTDGVVYLPAGGRLASNGDLWTTWGGLNNWLLTILARSKNVRLSAVGWWDRPAGQNAPDHNMGDGWVMTGLGGGYDGRVHLGYSRQIQQTDLWGNWFNVGSM